MWKRLNREKQMMSDPIAWCVPELPPNGAQRITATFQYCQAALWPAGPPHRGVPWFGLSRVKGNFHARFLGGRERVTARAYPTVQAGARKTKFLSVGVSDLIVKLSQQDTFQIFISRK